MTEDETRKLVWEVLTEFEKVKGQLQEHFAEKEAEIKKQEFQIIVDAMKELNNMSGKRDEQLLESIEVIAKGLATVTVKVAERLTDIEKLIVAKLGYA